MPGIVRDARKRRDAHGIGKADGIRYGRDRHGLPYHFSLLTVSYLDVRHSECPVHRIGPQ
jgi:hypothetical protein